MTEKEIAKSPEKTQRSDHSDRASHQTAQEAVVGDDKNQSLHHKAKLSDNQHNLSDPALLTPKEGESIEDYRKRVEAIQNNRFEITGLEEGTNSPQDKNDNMTTAEVKALGGKDAEMMFDAINKMPEGPEKDQAKEAIKASYTEVLSDNPQTDSNKSKLSLEGHISNTPESDTTEKIGWLDAAQKISQLPLDKQQQVIGAGLSAGITELNQQQRERSIGAVIGTVQGVGEIATNLGKIADFSAYCILGDDRAVAMGAEFGESLGKSIVGGIKLFEGAHKYLNDVGAAGAEGDYSKVFRDVSTLGENLNKAWSDLPPREQSRILAKLTTDMAADGLMGLGAARNLGKASKFTEILDTIAEDAQMLHKAGKSISNKTINKLQEAIDPVVGNLREHIGPKWAHATANCDDIVNGGIPEEISKRFVAMDLHTRYSADRLYMPEVPEHLRHVEIQKATPELLQAMEAKGRKITIAQPGSEDMRYLEGINADGSALLPDNMHVLLKENGSKIAALEEFLHGTQKKIGVIDRVQDLGMAEVDVKDFMIRHKTMLGLSEKDVAVLEALKQKELDKLIKRGWIAK